MFGLRPREAELVDAKLPEHLFPVYTATWIELVARCKLPASRKSVAIMLASFANADGTNTYPSLPKLAVMAGLTQNRAREHVQALEAIGLLICVKRGGGRRNPSVYRLVRPDLTALPLVLDPDMEPMPAEGYLPVAVETLPTAGGFEKTLPTEVGFPAPQTLPAAGGYEPVDNSAGDENPPDSAPKPPRFGTETLPTAGPDLSKTYPEPENLPGSSQATTSLGWRDHNRHPGAFADVVGLPDAEPWITPEPPAVSTLPAEHAAPSGRRAYADPPPPAPTAEPPRVVHAAAMCGPTPAIAAIFALLDAQPNHGEWWTAAARAELRREGIAHPNRLDLAIRAAMILRRSNPDTETRPA
jgi:biotin operon repressor